MSNLLQTTKQALEDMSMFNQTGEDIFFDEAFSKLSQAIAQAEQQEPVGYFAYDEEHDIWEELTGPNAPGATPLYTAPVRTKDLTDEEQLELARSSVGKSRHWLVAAVIAAYKEKNK